MQLLLLYRLKPGVSRAAYRAWSLARDQPTTRARPGIDAFRLVEVHSPDGSGDYDVAELVEVADWATWQRIVSSGPSVAIGEEFAELVDTASVLTLAGAEIVHPNPERQATA